MTRKRLHKILAGWGVDSRRNCEELIMEGLVRVNGKVVDDMPAFADPDKDTITVNGRKVQPQEQVYYLLNKPKGVICTNHDPRGRRKAIDYIDTRSRIFCVGRLDADTTGAIILTSDTALSDRLTHPRHHIMKSYAVTINGKMTPEAIAKLKKGVWLSEGKTMPATVKILKSHHSKSIIELKITQGLNRQIRRTMAKIGYKVTDLKRIKIGKISIAKLGPGRYRELTKAEVEYLKKI